MSPPAYHESYPGALTGHSLVRQLSSPTEMQCIFPDTLVAARLGVCRACHLPALLRPSLVVSANQLCSGFTYALPVAQYTFVR